MNRWILEAARPRKTTLMYDAICSATAMSASAPSDPAGRQHIQSRNVGAASPSDICVGVRTSRSRADLNVERAGHHLAVAVDLYEDPIRPSFGKRLPHRDRAAPR